MATEVLVFNAILEAIDALRMNEEELTTHEATRFVVFHSIPGTSVFWEAIEKLALVPEAGCAYSMVVAPKGSIRGYIASFPVDTHGKRMHVVYRF